MKSKVLGQGRWLSLLELDYEAPNGTLKTWECVRRVARHGAASIVATIEKAGEPHLIVVKQYRPPVGCYVLELPAGLIDTNEDAAATAHRELVEETGCVGQTVEVGPFVHNSPGLSDEKTALVRIAVTEQGEQRPDGDEAIEVLMLPLRGLRDRLIQEAAHGTHLDAKLWCFALGMEVARS